MGSHLPWLYGEALTTKKIRLGQFALELKVAEGVIKIS
jgi:hypothetical protein